MYSTAIAQHTYRSLSFHNYSHNYLLSCDFFFKGQISLQSGITAVSYRLFVQDRPQAGVNIQPRDQPQYASFFCTSYS